MWLCGQARAHAVPETDVKAEVGTLWVAAVRTVTTSGLDVFVVVQLCYCVSVGHCHLLLDGLKRSGHCHLLLDVLKRSGHAHSIHGDVCIYI